MLPDEKGNASGGTPLLPGAAFQVNTANTADGLALLGALRGESIAAAFFDPQYRGVLDKLRYGNEGVKRGMARTRLAQMCEADIRAFLAGIDAALIKGGHAFLWVDKFHLCEGVKPWLIDTRLSIVDMIVWDKKRIGMGYRSRRRAEYLLVLQKRPVRARGVWRDHAIPDVWCEQARKDHPHQKPAGLIQRLINAVTEPGGWVLDPAAGSYTVLSCCAEAGRGFVGCDLVAWHAPGGS